MRLVNTAQIQANTGIRCLQNMIQMEAFNTLQNSSVLQNSLWTEDKAKLMNKLVVKILLTAN